MIRVSDEDSESISGGLGMIPVPKIAKQNLTLQDYLIESVRIVQDSLYFTS